MKIINQIRLELEKFEKINLSCDADCSLGMHYDFACAYLSFIALKMREADEQMQKQKESSKIYEAIDPEEPPKE
jgi:hypothetical protein